MREILLFASCALAILGTSDAQTRIDLATELQRLQDGMASPDPIARIVALDEGTNSTRPVVRQKAIELGLTSSDDDLRAMALAASFSVKSSYNVRVSPNTGDYDPIMNVTAGNLDVRIVDFNPDSGDFYSFSSLSPHTSDMFRADEQPTYQARPGNLSGTRVQFTVATQTQWPECNVVAELSDSSAKMEGTIRCLQDSNTVSIDLLR